MSPIEANQQSLNFSRKETVENTQEAKINQTAAQIDAVNDARMSEEAKGNHNVIIKDKTVKPQKNNKVEKTRGTPDVKSVLVRQENADGLAKDFSGRQGNREYHLNIARLSTLAQKIGLEIHEDADPEQIIKLVRDTMSINGKKPDAVILDKTFDFLLEAASSQFGKVEEVDKKRLDKIYANLEAAKFLHLETHKIDIEVGHRIIGAVDLAVESNSNLDINSTLTHYREIVHTPTIDIQKVRKSYPNYEKLKQYSKGFRSFAGKKLQFNMENAELNQFIKWTKAYQAVEGVFDETKKQISTMKSLFNLSGILNKKAA